MRVHRALLSALAVTVTLTSVAAAGPAAEKQSVWIDLRIIPQSTFAFVPQDLGTLQRDTGVLSGNWRTAPGREVVRNGQKVGVYTTTWTLTGKRGKLTVRDRTEWVSAGNGDDAVAIGTWKVVRGTGAYAGVTGAGGSGHAGLGRPWYARFEGVVTAP